MSTPLVSDHNKASDPLSDSVADRYDELEQAVLEGDIILPPGPPVRVSANQDSTRHFPPPATDYLNPKTNTQFLQGTLQDVRFEDPASVIPV